MCMIGILLIGLFIRNIIAALWLTLILCFIIGLFGGIMNIAIFALVGLFAPTHMQGLMFGEGVAGIISLVPLILQFAMAAKEDSGNIEAIIFFTFAAAISVVALVMYLLMNRIPYSRTKIQKWKATRKKSPNHDLDAKESLLGSSYSASSSSPSLSASLSPSVNQPADDDDATATEDVNESRDTGKPNCRALISSSSSTTSQEGAEGVGFFRKMINIGKKQYKFGFAIFQVFFWSLIIFPQALLYVPPQKGFFNDNAFHPLWVIIKINIFTVCDWLSRFVQPRCMCYKTALTMNIISILRIIPTVILVLCIFVKPFQYFAFFIPVYVIFSLTNGFHATVIMTSAGDSLLSAEEKSLSSTFILCSFLVGIFLGVILAIPLDAGLKRATG